jgi:hypothetical protein
MLKIIVSCGCKITYKAAKDDVVLRRYRQEIFRLLLGTRADHGKTREICMLGPTV